VPDDPSQTIYVWLDALTSYLTATGCPWSSATDMVSGGWPADIHIIGKDILWLVTADSRHVILKGRRFHAVYFPSFLMALDLPLPRNILAHAHWTMGRQKMSKSIGNVVDPFQILDAYGTDSVRWYLARVGGNFVDDVGGSTITGFTYGLMMCVRLVGPAVGKAPQS
jgi:methionyl-tRNA synthetase